MKWNGNVYKIPMYHAHWTIRNQNLSFKAAFLFKSFTNLYEKIFPVFYFMDLKIISKSSRRW